MTRAVRTLIIGGGLAGLRVASALHEAGDEDWLLLEARDRWGGRLVSTPAGPGASAADAVDLGAAWFWPAMQPEFARWVDALGLLTLAQHEDGDLVFERSRSQAPTRWPGLRSEPPSRRVVGGMAALVAAVADRLPAERRRRGVTVTRLQATPDGVRVHAQASAPAATAPWDVVAQRVVLALPPRLAATRLRFEPALPPTVQREWLSVPTWMAPHAKYVAVYERPFWRDQGLSGAARSTVGPMGEIHDASGPDGRGALFGFLGVPAATRAGLSDETLRAACRAQLTHLFGDAAAHPLHEVLQDWARDPFTATEADWHETGHAHPPTATVDEGPWQGRLVGAASEWSPSFPGYVAGALEAAQRAEAWLRPGRPDVSAPARTA